MPGLAVDALRRREITKLKSNSVKAKYKEAGEENRDVIILSLVPGKLRQARKTIDASGLKHGRMEI